MSREHNINISTLNTSYKGEINNYINSLEHQISNLRKNEEVFLCDKEKYLEIINKLKEEIKKKDQLIENFEYRLSEADLKENSSKEILSDIKKHHGSDHKNTKTHSTEVYEI